MTIHEMGMSKLKQAQMLVSQMEHGGVSDRETLDRLARLVYWLMERWVREHDQRAK